MQKTKIEWTNAVWNPCDGCLNKCEYCYARKFANRFKSRYPNGFVPTFHPERLNEPYYWKRKKIGHRHDMVFTVSMGDFFGVGMQREWQDKVMHVIEDNPDLIFQILTKQPHLIPEDLFMPKNLWLGVSISNNSDLWRLKRLLSDKLESIHEGIKFCSFEPLFENIYIPNDINLNKLGWMIIGIQTNPTYVVAYEYIDRLYGYANRNKIPVFCKNSLIDNYPKVTKENQIYPVIIWEEN